MRSKWAERQLKALMIREGDALDLLTIHEAAEELGMESPLQHYHERREAIISEAAPRPIPKPFVPLPAHVSERLILPPKRSQASKRIIGPQSTEGFLYVIRSVAGKCKIGSAKDVQKRLAALQTGTHEPLELVLAKKTRFRTRLEAAIHRHFANKRITREWFDLTDADIAWIRGLPCEA